MTAHDLGMTETDAEIAPGIVPRDLHFNISAHANRHWFGGDQMKTAVIDSFSIMLPEGERFFIRSLKRYAREMDDEALKAEVRGYAVQEAYHTREHEDYNRALTNLGYDVETMERRVKRALEDDEDPLVDVAVTCAIEHVTATFSIAVLRDREALFRDADSAYRRLWTWHALEELEHAAVALKVYHKASEAHSGLRTYLVRVIAMNIVIVRLLWILVQNISSMAKTDGIARGPGLWWRFLKAAWGDPGYLRLGFWSFLQYYSPWFDPSKMVDPALVEKGRALLKSDMGEIPS